MANCVRNIFSKKNEINAGWALFAVAFFLIGTLVSGFPAVLIDLGLALMDTHREFALDQQSFVTYVGIFNPLNILIGDITGLVFLVLLARRIFPDHLKDGSPTGAAWIAGRTRDIFAGIFAGVFFAVLLLCLSYVLDGNVPFTKRWWQFFTNENIFIRLAYISTAIGCTIIVPVTEELMISGILYAGFNKSFGLTWGFILTLTFYVLMHGDKLASLPFLITVLCISTFALSFRRKTGTLGPLIAMHIAHNAAIIFCE
jgi:membrane protease YdiL (CAAX protease family)